MRIGSLFSGIGGFDLGLERAGHEIVWQVEIDESCRKVLTAQFQAANVYADVQTVGAHNLPAVELICGGFPCQDLSVAGKRAGLAGERSGLWGEFHRVVAEMSPRWVLIENVPGLLSSNQGRDMGVVISGLAQLGYGWAYRVLDAQYFGVPQRRRRVFIVGCFGDTRRAAKVLFEPESCSGYFAPSENEGAGSSSPLTEGTSGNGGGRVAAIDVRNLREQSGVVSGTLQSKRNGHSLNFQNPIAYSIIAREAKGVSEREGQTNLVVRTAHTAANGKGLADTAYALNAANAPGQAVTEITGVRRLTPIECERLQGFPDDWTAGGTDSARYRQLGNAVCVPVAEWIGRRLASLR